MPGLVGFFGQFERGESNALLEAMARALEPEDRFRVELFEADDVGLGRASLGILNPEPQPVAGADGALRLVMEGELYETEALRQVLEQEGFPVQEDDNAALALRCYEAFGEGFIHKLNGSFVLALWDGRSRRLLLANDRLGSYPLYYAHTNGRLLFASGVRAFLADPAFPRRVDKTAIAQLLTFDHVLSDYTLLEDARLLRQASLLVYDGEKLAVEPYWQLEHPEHYALRSETQWMESLLHLIRQATSRQNHDDLSAGVLLSGGLDSRIVLATLVEDAPSALQAFTWGVPGCDDLHFAREVAGKLGVPHHFFELEPDWLLAKAEEGVRRTDGLGNIVNLHALATIEEQAQHAQVVYKGYMGDAIFGFPLRHQFWATYDGETRQRVHRQVHEDQGVITFSDTEHDRLFSPSFKRVVNGAAWDCYRAAMTEREPERITEQRIQFGIRHRTPRMALNGVEMVRSRTAVRLPFTDYNLLSFALSLPPGLLYQRRLIKTAFVRAYPKLAQVPVTDTGLPMMDCLRDILIRAEDVVRWHLHNRGFKWVSYPRKRPYQNYNRWFRTVLRDWVEELLLDKRTLQRGYFNPDYVRDLVAEQMAGANHAVRLGMLLTLELWHRQFID